MSDTIADGQSGPSDQIRLDALTQVNRALREEARPTPPNRKRWVYGFCQQGEGNGFPELWVPRPLMFWSAVLRGGWEETPEQLDDPRLSLTLWPYAEQAVRAYLESLI